MTTTTYTQKQPNLGWVIILVILAVIIAFASVSTANSHAVTKHGTAGAMVRDCIDKGGTIGVYEHRTNKAKELWLCEIEPGLFGIQIRINLKGDKQDEVTAFTKSKMSKLEEVLRYIKNSGYIIGG